MAHPITFKPAPVDFHQELMRRVNEAPREHAEALLVLWDLLQTSHDQGILELVQGLVGGKDIITGKLAEAANIPESISAIRNGIALGRVLASLDPDMLHRLFKNLDEVQRQQLETEKYAAMHGSKAAQTKKDDTPSLWTLMKTGVSADARRGLGFGLSLLVALGRAMKPPQSKK
jgi:uncharacterized protein YjgD (DUF1641 family)